MALHPRVCVVERGVIDAIAAVSFRGSNAGSFAG